MQCLISKRVLYRTEHNEKGGPMELNFGGLEMQKRNILMETAQRVDEKMRSFPYLSFLLPELWSLKCQK